MKRSVGRKGGVEKNGTENFVTKSYQNMFMYAKCKCFFGADGGICGFVVVVATNVSLNNKDVQKAIHSLPLSLSLSALVRPARYDMATFQCVSL